MKRLLSILLASILCATAPAQTIRSLGYNSTNGQVVANTGTNVLTFTNAINFANAAATRTNLGLPLAILTNTSAENMLIALGVGGTPTNSANITVGNYVVYAATALWDVAENGERAFRVEDGDILIHQSMETTNAPTNTTNVVRWLKVVQGTNNYRVPLYK